MRNHLRKYLGLVMLLALLPIAEGCNAFAAASHAAQGAEKVKARYVPIQEPMLVLVEAWNSAGTINHDADQLSAAIYRILQEHHVAPLVDPQKLEKLKDSEPAKYRLMTSDGIGRAVGARQVLYVNVLRADVEAPDATQATRATMDATVRIIDASSGETRWPPSARDGAMLSAKTPWTRPDEQGADVHQVMVQVMSDEIGKLFYDSEKDDSEDVNPESK